MERIFKYKIRKRYSPKIKTCVGYNIPPHEAYIYKNIDGKPYCKFCAMKMQPPKPINKVSEKMKFKITIKKKLIKEDMDFYQSVWNKRFYTNTNTLHTIPKCECCSSYIGLVPHTIFFHHILEKRNYPQLRHEERNIAILCSNCHSQYEVYPDKVPYLVELRKKLLKLFNL